MSMFYLSARPQFFQRYLGLSCVLHAAFALVFWYAVKTDIYKPRTSGVDIAIRTTPGMPRQIAPKTPTRPGPQAAARPMMPAAPRRKIGRIMEKKIAVDMPKIEPQSNLRRTRHDDDVILNDRNIARFLRTENVELINIERKTSYQPPAPQVAMPQVDVPPGEYEPPTANVNVDVNIQYVEIPIMESSKIDIDAVQWSAPVVLPRNVVASRGEGDGESSEASPPGRRKALRVIKPEIPPNLGIQEPKVEVILRVVIAESGFISQAEIERSGGYLELDNRALAAVRQWIYESAMKREVRLVRVEYVF